jgi:DNA-binding GntR family transcriptional regulator
MGTQDVPTRDRTFRTSEHVYEVLRQRIITGSLRPGDVLNESQVMRELEVGRTPLREAVLLLARDDLVRTFHRRGTFISEITVERLQQALEVRPAIEAIALRLCVDKASDEDLQALRTVTAQADTSGSPSEVQGFDHHVHSAIVRLAGNEYLMDAWARVYTACSRLKYASLSPAQDGSTVRQELLDIVDRLIARDLEGALGAAQTHIQSFIASIGTFVPRAPSTTGAPTAQPEARPQFGR